MLLHCVQTAIEKDIFANKINPSERRVGRSEAETHHFQINVIVFLIGGMVVVGFTPKAIAL